MVIYNIHHLTGGPTSGAGNDQELVFLRHMVTRNVSNLTFLMSQSCLTCAGLIPVQGTRCFRLLADFVL